MSNNRKFLRRLWFFSLVTSTALILSFLFFSFFVKSHFDISHICLLIIFFLLTFELSVSFWTTIIGFILLIFQKNRVDQEIGQSYETINSTKTAIIMLTYNEDPVDFFKRVRTVYQSLIDYKCLHLFDIFILSDTNCPNIRLAEKQLWQKMCSINHAHEHLFYNNRAINTDAKSGHIDEFCTRWGDNYDFMIILDADSLMSAKALLQLVDRINANPNLAILQTAPKTYNQKSLFARILQFSNHIYGQIYCMGSAFWQLSDSNYFGHNAILRVDAFKKHAKLPILPGKAPLGGKILSHDFVEAALLREAGWQIEMCFDIVDSYEELPNNLINYAKRDRRWCQGNLQHSWFVFSKNMSMYSRFLFFRGIMAYLASPLWLCFFILSSIIFLNNHDVISSESTSAYEKQMLLFSILGFLFVPKILGLIFNLLDSNSIRDSGGHVKMVLSFLLECFFSVIITPILMLYRNQFIYEILLQQNIGWPAQERKNSRLSLKSAFKAHACQMLVGLAILAGVCIHAPNYIWWMFPFYFGLVISVPLSILLSSSFLGEKTFQWRLFCIPEEINPPDIIHFLNAQEKKFKQDFQENTQLELS